MAAENNNATKKSAAKGKRNFLVISFCIAIIEGVTFSHSFGDIKNES